MSDIIVAPSFEQPLKIVILTTLLMIASYTDIKDRRIPNILVLIILITGLSFSFYETGLKGINESVQSMEIAFGFTIFPYITKNLSAGDVKLLSVIGSFNTPFNTLLILFCFYGLSIIAYIFGMAKNYLITKKFELRIKQPYAPVITLSYFSFIILNYM